LEYLPTDKEQDRFLRQFYNAFKFESAIKIERITKATTSTIITIYEKLIKKDADSIFRQLNEKAQIYNQLIEPEKYTVSVLNDSLVNLERIGAAASYTFLLYLFSLNTESFYDNDLLEKVVDLLCKYYFRRNITDYPNTRDLDAINIDLIEKCQSKISAGEKLSFQFITNEILTGRGKPSTLATLESNLSDNIYDNNEGMARYALAKLDETNHSREYAPNLWARNEKGLYVWTIEHVFPKGNNIPQDWIDMIADGDKEEAEKIKDEVVHCFGNLTLSGYNSRLSNQSFIKKQSKTEANILGNKIFIGYKNGLALNKTTFEANSEDTCLAGSAQWKKEHIVARNKKMVNMLLTLFKFDTEEIDKS
ncbi:MAG: DUF1524 domain-containing protein, partial [Pseudomonadota bacterium]